MDQSKASRLALVGGGNRGPIPRDELRELSRLRPWRWTRDLVLDWGLIVLGFVLFDLVGQTWLLAPVFGLFIGCRQHALALLGHDATHRLAFPNRFWNDRAAELCGWPLGATLHGGYRDWHLEHHRRAGTPADPELAYRGHPPYTEQQSARTLGARFVGDLFGLGLPGLLAFLREIIPAERWRYLPVVALYAVAALLCVVLDAFWIFALWSWSLLSGFWACFRIRTWFEHVGLEDAGREGTHRFSAGRLVRFLFFPHNTHCHYEHHRWPQVPYPNLPALRRLATASQSALAPSVLPLSESLSSRHRTPSPTSRSPRSPLFIAE